MFNNYIGITIGPVDATLSLSASPAALWASSYIFSYISKRLCEEIVKTNLASKEDIQSPYYDDTDPLLIKNDGVGLFHDRIIFKIGGASSGTPELAKVRDLFCKVSNEIADLFVQKDANVELTRQWFRQYLQLHAVSFQTDGNPIADSARYLDAIELETTFPTVKVENPLAQLYERVGPDDEIPAGRCRNKQIIAVIRDPISGGHWPLCQKGYPRDFVPNIADIAGRNADPDLPVLKSDSYYAIVQSDGDHMLDTISAYEGDLRELSKLYLTYCYESSRIVQNYGGVTIYAGGDDLLFIAPLRGPKRGETILSLIQALQKTFANKFSDLRNSPTVSFGVAIRYYKYPLYEAFAEAKNMLREAKTHRDAAGISLQKHSGRAIDFVIEEFSTSKLPCIINETIIQEKEDFLNSVSTTIWKFQPLFEKACEEYFAKAGEVDNITSVFTNTFDASAHRDENDELKGEIKAVADLLMRLLSDKAVPPVRPTGPPGGERSVELQALYSLDAILRFMKFFSETGEEGRDA